MNKILIYEEGHIWFWDDPAYMTKDKGRCIPKGEACERYSRYVLIVQSTRTISDQNVLVAPITSTKKSDTIEITMMVNGKLCTGYVMTNKVFPVHVSRMVNYKCRISDDDLNKVRFKIADLLGISVHTETVIDSDFNPNIPLLIEAAECSCPSTSESEVEIVEICSTSQPVSDTGSSTTKSFPPERKWDEDTMKKFLEVYSRDPKEAETSFNVTPSSAQTYFYKFRKKLRELAAATPVEEEPEQKPTEESKEEKPTPGIIEKAGYSSVIVEKSISRLANAIRDDLMNKDIYRKIKMDKNLYSQGNFYQTLGRSIYFAMCEYTGLQLGDSRKVTRIDDVKQGTYDKFYNFLKVYYKNPTIRSMRGVSNACDIIRTQYNGEIPADMLPTLFRNEKKAFNKIPDADAEKYFTYINDVIGRYYMTY